MRLLNMVGRKSRTKHSAKLTRWDSTSETIYLMASMCMGKKGWSSWELKWIIPKQEEVTDPRESVQRIRLGQMLFGNNSEFLSFDSSSTLSKD